MNTMLLLAGLLLRGADKPYRNDSLSDNLLAGIFIMGLVSLIWFIHEKYKDWSNEKARRAYLEQRERELRDPPGTTSQTLNISELKLRDSDIIYRKVVEYATQQMKAGKPITRTEAYNWAKAMYDSGKMV